MRFLIPILCVLASVCQCQAGADGIMLSMSNTINAGTYTAAIDSVTSDKIYGRIDKVTFALSHTNSSTDIQLYSSNTVLKTEKILAAVNDMVTLYTNLCPVEQSWLVINGDQNIITNGTAPVVLAGEVLQLRAFDATITNRFTGKAWITYTEE